MDIIRNDMDKIIRFDDLSIGDLFLEEMESEGRVWFKIEPIERDCSIAINAIGLDDGTLEHFSDHVNVIQLKGELKISRV
jgi:hypothetical protein